MTHRRPGLLGVLIAAALSTFPLAAENEVTLWITLGDIDQLVEADAYTFKEIRRITTDPKLHGLAFSADGSKVYLASDRTGNFQVVDVRQGAVVDQINLGNDPNQMALTKDGRFAYVPLRGEDAVAVVQLEPLTLIKKIPMDKGPHDAYTSPDGTRIFVGAQFGRSIAVIDPAKQALNLQPADRRRRAPHPTGARWPHVVRRPLQSDRVRRRRRREGRHAPGRAGDAARRGAEAVRRHVHTRPAPLAGRKGVVGD
jgi:DNA-binding beta-propeller fold protein YncE